jgi:hypothetical protein
MKRFYFGLRGVGTLSPDTEGVEFDDAEEAYLGAFQAAQEMWPELLTRRVDPRAFAFEITDDCGTLVTTVPFGEVLDACRGHAAPPPKENTRTLWLKVQASAERMLQQSKHLGAQLAQTREEIQTLRRLLAEAGQILSELRSTSGD